MSTYNNRISIRRLHLDTLFFPINMDYKAEKITPYRTKESKTEQVREMFDSIAPAYDFMNKAMTFGIDRIWRRIAVRKLRRYPIRTILDVATGTGDLALLLYKKLSPEKICGIDLSEGMLSIARDKAKRAGCDGKIAFEKGDCLNLKYAEGAFDAVTVAYGVRNFEHLDKGYAEMYRVLGSGGVICVIELSTPQNPFIRKIYDLYTNHLIPSAGKLISKDVRAYSYLPESIAAVAQGNDMLAIMSRAGFINCRCYRLTFGTCTIYIGEKKVIKKEDESTNRLQYL